MPPPDPMHHSQRRAATAGAELVELLRLGLPIVVVQVGMTAMNFVDVAMLGHYRSDALAGMSIGNTLTWAVLALAMGVLVGTDPLLSQAVGAGDGRAVTRTLLRGALLAVLLAVPATLVLLPAETWLLLLGQQPHLAGGGGVYARINTLGFLPFLWFQLLRTVLAAHARVRAQMAVIVGANLANALLDWLLIFGHAGFPELGVAGAAWATVLCRWLMFTVLLALAWRDIGPHLRWLRDPALRAEVVDPRPLLRLLRLGLPIGIQLGLEVGVFALTALLVGWFGEHPLGGHQVAVQLASLSFMVPLGLSLATSVRVGWAVGRGDAEAARRTARVALLASGAVMAAFMAAFLLAPEPLARVLTDEPRVIAAAVALIPIAGVFQVGDGVQVAAIGCLRGAGDTRSPMVANVVGFWGLGLPIGCALSFGLGLGAAGLWWGLCIGLLLVAATLLLVVRRRFAGPARRILE